MKVIGLAGRAGSGKSAVARTLSQRPGIAWVDLDKVAWTTYALGRPLHQHLVDAFGEEILAPSGEIDRAKLAEAAFSNPQTRQTLNALVHPAVTEEIQSILREHEQKKTAILFLEGALLANSPYIDRSVYDLMLWLDVSEDVRTRRLDGMGRSDHVLRGRDLDPRGNVTVIDANGSVEDVANRILQAVESSQG